MPETPTDHISITSGAVEDFERFKLRRQAARIVPLLLDPLSRDHVIRHLDDSDEVSAWREAGRMAGRQLGIHVRTGPKLGRLSRSRSAISRLRVPTPR